METPKQKNQEVHYSEITKKFINKIHKYIVDTYGQFPEEFELSERFLADDIELYLDARHSIAVDGTAFKTDTGKVVVNPAFTVQRDTQRAIVDILKQFGLTSMSRSKIKMQDNSSPDEYINDLLS